MSEEFKDLTIIYNGISRKISINRDGSTVIRKGKRSDNKKSQTSNSISLAFSGTKEYKIAFKITELVYCAWVLGRYENIFNYILHKDNDVRNNDYTNLELIKESELRKISITCQKGINKGKVMDLSINRDGTFIISHLTEHRISAIYDNTCIKIQQLFSVPLKEAVYRAWVDSNFDSVDNDKYRYKLVNIDGNKSNNDYLNIKCIRTNRIVNKYKKPIHERIIEKIDIESTEVDKSNFIFDYGLEELDYTEFNTIDLEHKNIVTTVSVNRNGSVLLIDGQELKKSKTSKNKDFVCVPFNNGTHVHKVFLVCDIVYRAWIDKAYARKVKTAKRDKRNQIHFIDGDVTNNDYTNLRTELDTYTPYIRKKDISYEFKRVHYKNKQNKEAVFIVNRNGTVVINPYTKQRLQQYLLHGSPVVDINICADGLQYTVTAHVRDLVYKAFIDPDYNNIHGVYNEVVSEVIDGNKRNLDSNNLYLLGSKESNTYSLDSII